MSFFFFCPLRSFSFSFRYISQPHHCFPFSSPLLPLPSTINQATKRSSTPPTNPLPLLLTSRCYHPTPWTEIAALAEKAGWQVILGTEAVIYQGLEQDKYWTGKELEELPVEEVKEVIANELLKSKL